MLNKFGDLHELYGYDERCLLSLAHYISAFDPLDAEQSVPDPKPLDYARCCDGTASCVTTP